MVSNFVTHELAKELKELGFNEPCLAWYTSTGNFSFIHQTEDYTSLSNNDELLVKNADVLSCVTPTYQQAIQFLLPKLSGIRGAYRVIVVQATGAYWLQERVGHAIGVMKGISDETNEDCVRQLIKVIKFGEKY